MIRLVLLLALVLGTFSDYLELKLLDHVFGGGDYTRPGTLYVAVCTDAPTDAGGGTEPSGGAYARVAVTNNATNFPAASAGAKANGTEIAFPQASASWGLLTHFKIMDAASGGNQIGWGALSTSKQIDSGDTPKFPVGDLDVTLN